MFAQLLKRLETITAMLRNLLPRFGQCDQKLDLIISELAIVRCEQAQQNALLQHILAAVTLPPAVRVVLAFEVEGQRTEGEHIKMKVEQNKQGLLTAAFKRDDGSPGLVDGVPQWTASPDGVVTLTPAADGLTCDCVTLPPPTGSPAHSVVIECRADGDLGDGVKPIIGTASLTVYDPTAGATIVDISVGAFGDIQSQG